METQSEILEPPEKPSLPERLGEWIIVPLMLGVIAIGFAAVCLRFLFGGHYALFWSEEVIRYAFIWLFWLCAPILVWRSAMFSVDLLVATFPLRLQALVKILTNFAIIILMGYYVYYGWIMAELNGRQLSSALTFPLFWIYLAIPVGSALVVLALLIQTAKLVPQLFGKGTAP